MRHWHTTQIMQIMHRMFFFIMCHASCIMNRESFPPACTTNHALSTFLAMHTRSFDHAPYLTPRMDLS